LRLSAEMPVIARSPTSPPSCSFSVPNSSSARSRSRM